MRYEWYREIMKEWGYEYWGLTVIKYPVLLGYYAAIVPGYMYKYYDSFKTFLLAVGLTVVTYSCLGVIAEFTSGSVVWILLIIVLLFLASLSSTLATFTSISLMTNNFPQSTSMLSMLVLAVYYRISSYFELCIRRAFFSEVPLHIYLTIIG